MNDETQQRIEETKKHLLEMRRDLSQGVQDPEKAAQAACAGLLTLTDLLEYFIGELEADELAH